MPKCPSCGVNTSYLVHYVNLPPRESLFCLVEGKPRYEPMEKKIEDDAIDEYQCPECSTTLFTEEEAAVAFLKGEEPKKEKPVVETPMGPDPDEDADEGIVDGDSLL